MPLTAKTKARLITGLTRKALANEFDLKMTTPGPISAKLKAAIISMMANKAAGNEIINALQTGGNQVLSGPKHPNAKRRLLNALTRKSAADEIDVVI